MVGYLQEELNDRRIKGNHDFTQLDAYGKALERQSLIMESDLVSLQLGVTF